jgi:hypothetical protein
MSFLKTLRFIVNTYLNCYNVGKGSKIYFKSKQSVQIRAESANAEMLVARDFSCNTRVIVC